MWEQYLEGCKDDELSVKSAAGCTHLPSIATYTTYDLVCDFAVSSLQLKPIGLASHQYTCNTLYYRQVFALRCRNNRHNRFPINYVLSSNAPSNEPVLGLFRVQFPQLYISK